MTDRAPLAADLVVRGLSVSVDEKEILRGVDLSVPAGQIHALMGPNGSGKSTLAYTLSGHPKYTVTSGSATFGGEDLLALRAQGKEMPAREFIRRLNEEMAALRIDESFRARYINDGFSGGEKKRAEILQMAMLRPRLSILDETDSGLDVDALRTVANGVTRLAGPDMSVLVITHYPRILDYLKPDRIHVLHQGRVITSGGPELAQQIERDGYEPIIGPVAAATGASRTSLTGVVAEAQA